MIKHIIQTILRVLRSWSWGYFYAPKLNAIDEEGTQSPLVDDLIRERIESEATQLSDLLKTISTLREVPSLVDDLVEPLESEGIPSIDFSGWDTSNVANLADMLTNTTTPHEVPHIVDLVVEETVVEKEDTEATCKVNEQRSIRNVVIENELVQEATKKPTRIRNLKV